MDAVVLICVFWKKAPRLLHNKDGDEMKSNVSNLILQGKPAKDPPVQMSRNDTNLLDLC